MVLASADGEREVPLADYFTGYRQTRAPARRADPRGADPAAARAGHRLPQDRQAPVRRHLQRRRRLRARRRRRRRVRGRGSGSAASRPPRSGRSPPRRRSRAGRGRRRPSATAAAVLAGEGTPLDDHRASAAYRTAMLGTALLKLYADDREPARRWRHERAVRAAERPRRRDSRSRTRAPRCTSPAQALYTDDLVRADQGRAARLPGAGAARARPGHRARPPPRARRARRRAGAHRRRRAGRQRRRRQARRAAVPRRGDVLRPRRLLGARRDARGGPARAPLAVEVDYEPLPSLVTVREAIAAEQLPGRPAADGARRRRGAGSPASDHVFSGEIEFAGQEHFYLETHCSLAQVDENGQVFVQSSTQHPSETQEIVAHVLGLPSHDVTVQCLRMGGGFGGKEMQPHGFAAVAALGAMLTGRPVRLRLNRTQDMTMSGKRHGFHAQWRVGFDDDGRLQALDATLTSDGGWSLDLSEPVLARALCHIDNAYWIPNVRVNGRIAKTNKTSQTAFRGFGGPQGMLVHRGHPRPLRAAARPRPGRPAPPQLLPRGPDARRTASRCGTPSGCGDRGSRCWTPSDFAGAQRADRASSTPRHEHTKRGLAITPVKFGISFNFTAFNQAGALVHVYKDGSVLINHGGTEMGQGLHTKMLQVAATTLGVPLEQVRLAPTRTDKVPNTSATAASSGRRPERRRRSRTPASRSAAGWRWSRRSGSGSVPPTCGSPAAHVRGLSPSAEPRRPGRPGRAGLLPAGPAVGGRLLPHRGAALGLRRDAGRAVQVLRLRRGRRPRSRSTASPARTARGGSTSCTTSATASRRWSTSARSRAGSCRERAGSPWRTCAGTRRDRPTRGRARHPGGEHLQAAELLRDARGLQRRAAGARHRGGRGLRLEGGRASHR